MKKQSSNDFFDSLNRMLGKKEEQKPALTFGESKNYNLFLSGLINEEAYDEAEQQAQNAQQAPQAPQAQAQQAQAPNAQAQQQAPQAQAQPQQVDINQVASQLQFQPTSKKKLMYQFVQSTDNMPAMSYSVAQQQMPVVTMTADGKETQNTAEPNDVVMSGPSREQYVIKSAKFPKLYQGQIGGPVNPEQGPRNVAIYNGQEQVNFTAPWGENMVLKPGDYLVKEAEGKYYRIAKQEYEKTYNAPGKVG
jgi:hypothetical protein